MSALLPVIGLVCIGLISLSALVSLCFIERLLRRAQPGEPDWKSSMEAKVPMPDPPKAGAK
jgi:hypothetical protein